MTEKQVDVELNRILKSYFVKLVRAIRLHYKRAGKHFLISKWINYWEDRRKDKEEMISQLKSLFKKKLRECIHYKTTDIGVFDNEENLIKKYPKPKEIIIKDSPVIKEILENIDKEFK